MTAAAMVIAALSAGSAAARTSPSPGLARASSCGIIAARSGGETVRARVSASGATCALARRLVRLDLGGTADPLGWSCLADDESGRCTHAGATVSFTLVYATTYSKRCTPQSVAVTNGSVRPLGIVQYDRDRARVQSCVTASRVTSAVVKALFADGGRVSSLRTGGVSYVVVIRAASMAVAEQYGDPNGVTIASATSHGYTVSVFLGE